MKNIILILILVSMVLVSGCIQKSPIVPILCGSAVSFNESDFELRLSNHIDEVKSLEELEMWLNSQECIRSAKLSRAVIETLPEQREIFIKLKMSSGSISNYAIDVALLENNKFKFVRIHEG